MQAYLNQPALKAKMVRAMRAHRKADRLVRGSYGNGADKTSAFRGCAVGCALQTLNGRKAYSDHDRFPTELGIPVELAHTLDHFFENLPEPRCFDWPVQVLTAITTGADLSEVVPVLMQWSILDPVYGWMAYADTAAKRDVVLQFASTVARDWRDRSVTDQEWSELTRTLDTVISEWTRVEAWAGAWARAWARARVEARARAWARAGARARVEAWAEARAEARADKDVWYTAAADECLRLIREAK